MLLIVNIRNVKLKCDIRRDISVTLSFLMSHSCFCSLQNIANYLFHRMKLGVSMG